MELRYAKRDLDPAARAFYDRLAEGEFCVGVCDACARRAFPPREFCHACGARTWSLAPHPGSGVVYAFTTQERGFRFVAPDVIGVVELDDGAGFAFGLIRGTLEGMRIGDAVVLEPVEAEPGWIVPAWTRFETAARDEAS